MVKQLRCQYIIEMTANTFFSQLQIL